MKFFIIGVEKCATTSFENDLKNKGHDVIRWEWAYCLPNIIPFIKKYYPDHEILIVIRDPIDRCYSDYHYAVKRKQIQNIPYIEALKKYPRFAQGSCYEKWIPLADRVITMDEIKSKNNVGSYSPLTDEERELTIRAIEQAKLTEYHREYSEIDWYKIKVYFSLFDKIKGNVYQILKRIRRF